MMIAGVFADPGAGIDWIALIQITLAFALLSVCCWLIGATVWARRQARRRGSARMATGPLLRPLRFNLLKSPDVGSAAQRPAIAPPDASPPSETARRRPIC
jgi:hypothetical protein